MREMQSCLNLLICVMRRNEWCIIHIFKIANSPELVSNCQKRHAQKFPAYGIYLNFLKGIFFAFPAHIWVKFDHFAQIIYLCKYYMCMPKMNALNNKCISSMRTLYEWEKGRENQLDAYHLCLMTGNCISDTFVSPDSVAWSSRVHHIRKSRRQGHFQCF